MGEVILGLAGQSNVATFNPMRDTVFQGNEEAYDAAEWVAASTMQAGREALNSMGLLGSNEKTSSERIKTNAGYDNSGEGAGGADGATYEGTIYRNVNSQYDPLEMNDYTINSDHRYTKPGTPGLYFSSGKKLFMQN